jgi:fructose-1,6-bisphosphatase/inositol monophosphatase family enzyme
MTFVGKTESDKLLLLEKIENSILAAGNILMKGFGSKHELMGSVDKKTKSRSNINSSYDTKSNRIILKILLPALFDVLNKKNEILIISEGFDENKIADRNSDIDNLNSFKSMQYSVWEGYSLAIDPLCGSIPYARGVADFVVSICLLKGKIPIIGLVYDPVHKEMFSAIKDIGAFLSGKKINPSTTTLMKNTYVSLEHKIFRDFNGKDIITLANEFTRIRVAGTCGLELCYVACGRLDAMIKLKQPLYDYSAGVLILWEALKNSDNLNGLTLLDLNKEKIPPTSSMDIEVQSLDSNKNTHIIASNQLIHDNLLKNITPMIP